MTNRFIEELGIHLRALHHLQQDLLAQLSDSDLQYALPGRNPTLGKMLRDMGDWQRQYIESFETFQHDFNLHLAPADAETSVATLQVWFAKLAEDFMAALEALSNDDLERPIDRGNWSPRASLQFHLYREMLFIYYGHLNVYVRAMDKTISHQWEVWIG